MECGGGVCDSMFVLDIRVIKMAIYVPRTAAFLSATFHLHQIISCEPSYVTLTLSWNEILCLESSEVIDQFGAI